MRILGPLVFAGMVAVSSVLAQAPAKKKGGLAKVAAKLVDSTITATAAGAVDSLLGTKAGRTSCPAGTVPASAGGTSAGPTVGSEVVATAKKKLIGAKADSTVAQTAQPAACVPPPAAAVHPSAVAPSKAAALTGTVGVAVAAAPVAAKAVGGLLGKKGPNKASMIKELTKGRLILKGIKFIAASDALEEPIDDDVAALAEALAAMEGQYLLNMPAEARDQAAPDTVIARRRLNKLVAHLQVAGAPADRITVVGIYPPGLDKKAKAPKPGDARPEVMPVPKDLPPPEL